MKHHDAPAASDESKTKKQKKRSLEDTSGGCGAQDDNSATAKRSRRLAGKPPAEEATGVDFKHDRTKKPETGNEVSEQNAEASGKTPETSASTKRPKMRDMAALQDTQDLDQFLRVEHKDARVKCYGPLVAALNPPSLQVTFKQAGGKAAAWTIARKLLAAVAAGADKTAVDKLKQEELEKVGKIAAKKRAEPPKEPQDPKDAEHVIKVTQGGVVKLQGPLVDALSPAYLQVTIRAAGSKDAAFAIARVLLEALKKGANKQEVEKLKAEELLKAHACKPSAGSAGSAAGSAGDTAETPAADAPSPAAAAAAAAEAESPAVPEAAPKPKPPRTPRTPPQQSGKLRKASVGPRGSGTPLRRVPKRLKATKESRGSAAASSAGAPDAAAKSQPLASVPDTPAVEAVAPPAMEEPKVVSPELRAAAVAAWRHACVSLGAWSKLAVAQPTQCSSTAAASAAASDVARAGARLVPKLAAEILAGEEAFAEDTSSAASASLALTPAAHRLARRALPLLIGLSGGISHPVSSVKEAHAEDLIKRLETDEAFAEEYVMKHSTGAVRDLLQRLSEARVDGIPTTARLYTSKLNKELQQRHLPALRASASAAQRTDELSSAASQARAALEAALSASAAADPGANVDAGEKACVGDAKVASAAEVDVAADMASKSASAAEKLRACALPESLQEAREGSRELLELARTFSLDAFANAGDSSRSVAAAAAVANFVASVAGFALARTTETLQASIEVWESQRVLASLKEETSEADGVADRLERGDGDLGRLRDLLRDFDDEELRKEALDELHEEQRRASREKLAEMEGMIASLERDLAGRRKEELTWTAAARAAEAAAAASAAAKAAEDAAAAEVAAAAAAAADATEAAVSETGAGTPALTTAASAGRGLLSAESVTAPDWERLQDGMLLNDTLLDFFIGNLVKELAGSTKVHAFSSHFFSRLTSMGARDGFEGWDHVKTWTRGVKSARGPLGIFACDSLLLPVHSHDSTHWNLAVVSRPWAGAASLQDGSSTPTLTLLDSLGADAGVEAHMLHFIRGFLAQEWKACGGEGGYDEKALVAAPCEVGLQANDTDCGIFVLEFVLELLRRPELLASLGRPGSPCLCAAATHDLQIRARWRRAGADLRGGERNWLPEELRCDNVESGDRSLPAAVSARAQREEEPEANEPDPEAQAASDVALPEASSPVRVSPQRGSGLMAPFGRSPRHQKPSQQRCDAADDSATAPAPEPTSTLPSQPGLSGSIGSETSTQAT